MQGVRGASDKVSFLLVGKSEDLSQFIDEEIIGNGAVTFAVACQCNTSI
jgi:hypothetical protein